MGGTPGVGLLSGRLWHDADFDDALDAGERLLAGWIVELFGNGALLQSVVTDADGTYQIGAVTPNVGDGVAYVLRFRAPDAGASSAKLGLASSPFTNGLQQISDIVVPSGSVTCEPQPADRPERRGLRLDPADARRRRDA